MQLTKLSPSIQSYLTNQGFGFGTDNNNKTSNRHSGHGFIRQCSNFMTQKVYSQAFSISTIQPTLIVDVGAQVIRSSSILKNMRTPTFDFMFNKLKQIYKGEALVALQGFRDSLETFYSKC